MTVGEWRELERIIEGGALELDALEPGALERAPDTSLPESERLGKFAPLPLEERPKLRAKPKRLAGGVDPEPSAPSRPFFDVDDMRRVPGARLA